MDVLLSISRRGTRNIRTYHFEFVGGAYDNAISLNVDTPFFGGVFELDTIHFPINLMTIKLTAGNMSLPQIKDLNYYQVPNSLLKKMLVAYGNDVIAYETFKYYDDWADAKYPENRKPAEFIVNGELEFLIPLLLVVRLRLPA